MKYLSVCSGIEAATVAWHPLGWTPVGFAEIDKFASAVLAERFGSNLPGAPLAANGVPNYGDFTAIDLDTLGTVDALVGGTPCQAFSFAGRRLSLADARGNLTLAYAVLAHELARSHGLRNAIWENVPGVLSTDDNAFGCFLGALVGADAPLDLPRGVERWPDAGMASGPRARAAWRVLDAQYFGLAQRRERVFVVVDFGNGADPAAVLFERQGLSGNSPPSREKGQGIAPTLAARTRGGGGLGTDFDCDGGLIGEGIAYGGGNRSGAIDVAATLVAKGNKQDFEVETFIAHAPETAATLTRGAESAGKGGYAGRRQEDDVYLVAEPFAFKASHYTREKDGAPSEVSPPLSADADRGDQDTLVLAPVAFDTTQITSKASRSNPQPGDPVHPLTAKGHPPTIAFQPRFARNDRGAPQEELAYPLTAEAGRTGKGDSAQCVVHGWAVRRLTTVECARLQGFPDHHSRIAWRGKPAEQCPDGPQYKTYGNSMAVEVMRWIGRQIDRALAA